MSRVPYDGDESPASSERTPEAILGRLDAWLLKQQHGRERVALELQVSPHHYRTIDGWAAECPHCSRLTHLTIPDKDLLADLGARSLVAVRCAPKIPMRAPCVAWFLVDFRNQVWK